MLIILLQQRIITIFPPLILTRKEDLISKQTMFNVENKHFINIIVKCEINDDFK